MDPKYTYNMYEAQPLFRNVFPKNKHVSEIVNLSSIQKSKDEQIKKIPDYILRFSPIKSKSLIDDSKDFVMITKENLTPLATFFLKRDSTDAVSLVISSLNYLLKSYQILNDNNIIHVNYTQIGFRDDLTPILFDFIEQPVPPYYLPIELFVLNHFLGEDRPTLSILNVEEICTRFGKLNGKQLTDHQLKSCVKFFSPIFNKSRIEIIRILSTYKNQWHIYGLAKVYIQLIGMLDIVHLPSFISDVLFQCTCLIPNERLSAQELFYKLNENRYM
tara:strand:- start:13289 stop:14110 length:822 start_codon:yes stop_codon:yes gene_type:complete